MLRRCRASVPANCPLTRFGRAPSCCCWTRSCTRVVGAADLSREAYHAAIAAGSSTSCLSTTTCIAPHGPARATVPHCRGVLRVLRMRRGLRSEQALPRTLPALSSAFSVPCALAFAPLATMTELQIATTVPPRATCRDWQVSFVSVLGKSEPSRGLRTHKRREATGSVRHKDRRTPDTLPVNSACAAPAGT